MRLLRSQVDLQQLAAVLAASQGGEVEPVSMDAARERFDAMLAAAPADRDDPDAELREALGLTGG